MKLHTLIILIIASIVLFGSVCIYSQNSHALTPQEILVVYNTDSSIKNASQGTAEYYSSKRGIPASNILGISTEASESIPDTRYINEIAAPIWKVLSQPAYSNIKVILLCHGIPTRISGKPAGGVDSALTLLGNPNVLEERSWALGYPNPYYNANAEFASFKNSPANVIDRGKDKKPWKINYLVARLDGYSLPATTVTVGKQSYSIPRDVKAIIDRAVRADAAGKAAALAGNCVLDDAPYTNTDRALSKPLADYLRRLGMKVDHTGSASAESNTYAVNKSNVMLYTSNGSYDYAAKQDTIWWRPNISLWKDGAIGIFYKVSGDARSLRMPDFLWPIRDNEPAHIENGTLKVYLWDWFRPQIPFKNSLYANYQLVLFKADGKKLASTTFNKTDLIDNVINGKREIKAEVPVARIDLTKISKDSLSKAYWVVYFPKDDPLHPGEAFRRDSASTITFDSNTNNGITYAAVMGQCLSSELIREGCTAVTGNVCEPTASGCADPHVILSQYASGCTWVESAYMSFPAVSWMSVAVGDPLMAPFKKRAVISLTMPEK